MLRLRAQAVLPVAYSLVLEHRLRRLDAIHLAVALEECPTLAGDDEVVFETSDEDQATAAAAGGVGIGMKLIGFAHRSFAEPEVPGQDGKWS